MSKTAALRRLSDVGRSISLLSATISLRKMRGYIFAEAAFHISWRLALACKVE
jgi:hypothetical protein